MTAIISPDHAGAILLRGCPAWQQTRGIKSFKLVGVLGTTTGLRYKPGGGARADEFRYVRAADVLGVSQSASEPAPSMVELGEPEATIDLQEHVVTGVLLAGSLDWQPAHAFARYEIASPGNKRTSVSWCRYSPRTVALGLDAYGEGTNATFAYTPLDLVVGVQARVMSDMEIAEIEEDKREAADNLFRTLYRTDEVTFTAAIERQGRVCSKPGCGRKYGDGTYGWVIWHFNEYTGEVMCGGPGGCSPFEHRYPRGDGGGGNTDRMLDI